MKPLRASLVVLAMAALAASGARARADDDKEKAAKAEKDKAAKAKPPARSYSDADLKKYKDKPAEDGSAAPAGPSGGEAATQEPAPGRRRGAEYGSQDRPPSSTAPSPSGQAQGRVEPPPVEDPKSPEEAEWRARAKGARAPLNEALGRIQAIETQMADLRDKLNPMSTKYVLGGNSNAGPGAVLEVEEELRSLDAELTGTKAAAAEAEKSWQAFLEEARAASASPAWLNP